MRDVIGLKKCPKCGNAMEYHFDGGTTEESQTCLCCGYYQEWYLLRDKNGAVRTNGKGGWLGDYTESIGYGVAYLSDKYGLCVFKVFDAPLSDSDMDDLLKSAKENFSVEKTYITSYDPKTNTMEVLYGKIPDEYVVYKE